MTSNEENTAECTKLNCPLQVGTIMDKYADNCPWRMTIDDLICFYLERQKLMNIVDLRMTIWPSLQY